MGIQPVPVEPVGVMEEAVNVACDYKNKAGMTALARDMHMVYTTLNHQLTGVGSAKLGILTALKMTVMSNDPRILAAFARECGYFVLPLPECGDIEGQPTMQLLAEMAARFADVMKEVCASCEDDDVSDNEMARIVRAWGILQATGVKAIGALERKNLESPTHMRAVA
jgi:hypothetical protein